MSQLLIYRQRGYDGEHVPGGRRWNVYDPFTCNIIARFQSHRAALHYALWKSGLKRNYGSY